MSGILRISDAASLAMHTMVLLADLTELPLSAREIASKLHASAAHLSKVLQRLGKARLVRSVRGPKGGFLLARAADEITLLEVYEVIEGPLVSARCLLGNPVCAGAGCILGGLLESVNRQVREYLSGATLSELTRVYHEPAKKTDVADMESDGQA